MRHFIEVAALEFDEGGNTIWVHDSNGNTVLRIKCTGRIWVQNECENPAMHGDLIVCEDIKLCLPATHKID